MNKLYRRNNNGAPTVWWAELDSGTNSITVFYGLVRGNIRKEVYAVTQKDGQKELESRYNDKIKQGYTYLNELCDMQGLPPVEDGDNDTLFNFLNTYLPKDLSNGNSNLLLPMLAKTYSGNVWKKVNYIYGQYKINGLRCIITAYTQNDMFKPVKLRFQSREGIIWNSLDNLSDYLLSVIPTSVIRDMIDGYVALDGEVYLPGYTINQINHFVKDSNCVENKLLQFWCYDIMMEGDQRRRNYYRYTIKSPTDFNNINDHLNNKERLITLPNTMLTTSNETIETRNHFINLGFEGLILRNPDMDYQYGRRRANYMEKFKDAAEGDFIILDIYKEKKRDLPILLCKNDINDEKFETRLSVSHIVQQEVLFDSQSYIGRTVHIEYGERSGVARVPFHIKTVVINGDTRL
ncbi:MAG: ATP dependent DNA ligase domain protein [Bacteriophage sp.]|nr:MAG: ATP dependent DNA ligase domain protein [Bacteriophage sp.]